MIVILDTKLMVPGNLFLYTFALDKPAGHKIYRQSRIKFLERLKKSILSRITLSLDEIDQKPIDFNSETISCACKLNKN